MRGFPDTARVYYIFNKKPQIVQQAIDIISRHKCCKISIDKRKNSKMISDEYYSDDTGEVETRRVNGKHFVTEECL